jgi:hypothetical protein
VVPQFALIVKLGIGAAFERALGAHFLLQTVFVVLFAIFVGEFGTAVVLVTLELKCV